MRHIVATTPPPGSAWQPVASGLAGRARSRLWVPTLPVALVLSPLLILAALGAAIACLAYHIKVVRAFGAISARTFV